MLLPKENSFTRELSTAFKELNFEKPTMTEDQFKKLSHKEETKEIPTRIKTASADGKVFLASAIDMPRGYKQAQDGSIWGIEKDADGVEWLVRNIQDAEVNDLANSML